MRRRLLRALGRARADERGSVVLTAVVVVTVMLGIGLSSFAYVDTQQRQSGRERVRESALNLSEGVLYTQSFRLAQGWPGTAAGAYPATCSAGDASPSSNCPNEDLLASSSGSERANFTAPDFGDATWTTKVRDNGNPPSSDYNPATADSAQAGCTVTPCTYDANGDKKLWVQASATVRGRKRAIVALLELERLSESLPQNVVTAGHFRVTNNGNHGGRPIIDVTGSQVAVRCNPQGANCASYRAGQVSPANVVQISQTSAFSQTQLERLEARARADGKYFETCPPGGSSADLSGAVVWVDNCSAHYAGSLVTQTCTAPLSGRCINQPNAPGLLIWRQGTLRLTGNATYVGLIAMLNSPDPPAEPLGDYPDQAVLDLGGAVSVYGGISIDGNGGLDAGSNGGNIRYNVNAFSSVRSYGTTGLVQNTWRELPPGSPGT